MSDKEKYDFSNYIKNAQKKVKEFVLERDQLNNKLKNYILSFQNIDYEIYKTLFDAREFYNNKRYQYNNKLANLKRQKIEDEHLWNKLTKKSKKLQKPKLNSNISTSIGYVKRSLQDIESKILVLNKKLKEQILDIYEENEIIEELRELERIKQKKINLKLDLEQKQVKNLQNNEYYKTQRRIENLEKNLKKNFENIIKFHKKRLMTHKKMFNLYKKSKKFETTKKDIINELSKNKIIARDYLQLFLKLIKQNKNVLFEELSIKPKTKLIPNRIKPPKVKTIDKQKNNYKKLEQKKLKIALEKKKKGKKLDFYELQLILKHTKNKRV